VNEGTQSRRVGSTIHAFSWALVALVVAGLLSLVGCATVPPRSLVGSWYAPQLCSMGKDFDLTLAADGTYRLVTTLPEGVGPELGEGVRAGFEEVGTWRFDGTTLTLWSAKDQKITRLKFSDEGGKPVLSDGAMFGLRFEKQQPVPSS